MASSFLGKRDVEGGWLCLHAAQRYAVNGLSSEELLNRARILRAERVKLSAWRAKIIDDLLREESTLTPDRVMEAMRLRDEHDQNQYHKISLTADQLGVLVLGMFGSSFSVVQSIITDTSGAKIPERVANHWVTFIRALFGAIAGLAGYALLRSNMINLKMGDGGDPVAFALSVAFLFGYTGERLIAKVADTVGGAKRTS